VSYDIAKWTYIGENYPALSSTADNRLDALNSELATKQRKGYIGILGVGNLNSLKPQYAAFAEPIGFFSGLFFWLFLINFGVGAFNMLPMLPLDGERVWRVILQRFVGQKRAAKVMQAFSLLALLLLLAFFYFVLA
jgi:membrane-associated protease RseP (regulator of RpoE activity)